jgi:molybdopterin molybdochelatase
MNRFLTVISVPEALQILCRLTSPPVTEILPLWEATGRVLADEARSAEDIPGFSRSVVDGYAVRARDTTGASDSIPAMLRYRGRIPMGVSPSFTVQGDECAYIPTGGVLPEGSDAVAMIEYCEQVEDQVLIHRPVAPGENVLQRGEDFSRGSLILPGGHRLRPQDMGVLAAAGFPHVKVYRIPRIGILSTGNEIIPIEQIPGPGQVRDANSSMIHGFLIGHGCKSHLYGILPDDPDLLRDTLKRAAGECDAVILSGGSSKDTRDVSARVIGELGEVLVHGIALQPGKPTIIGRIRGAPVVGLPGHPASAYIVLQVLGIPLLERMTGQPFPPVRIPAVLGENIPSSRGREDYVRVKLEDGTAYPLFGKSGLLNTLVRSDGMVRIPAESEGLEAGAPIEVVLW